MWATRFALLLMLVPLAGAQTEEIESTPGTAITFYGHIFDIQRGSPMPMNTQFPVGEDDFSRGWGGGCGAPPPAPDDSADCESWNLNENFWYTTAGFVQVKNADEWGGDYAQFHNERGQTKDIFLDTSMPIEATYFMSADFHGWSTAFCPLGACWNWDPGMLQDWVVEVWVWHAALGDWSTEPSSRPDVSAISSRSSDATLIAHGKSDPKDMVSIDETIPGGTGTVNEFQVPVAWDAGFDGRVPYLNDLIVEFEWYQETEGQKYILGNPGGLGGIVWNVNTGEDYPARVTLPVRNPLDVELVFPRFIHDKLVVLAVINTPWGSYDIDPGKTTFTVRDESGNVVQVDPALIQSTLDNSVAHSGHYKPINGTWVWDYQTQGLAPGKYTVTVGATNFQNSYSTSTEATFEITSAGTGGATSVGRSGLQSFTQEDLEEFQSAIGGDEKSNGTATLDEGEKGSPGFVVAAALGAIALAAWRRRA